MDGERGVMRHLTRVLDQKGHAVVVAEGAAQEQIAADSVFAGARPGTRCMPPWRATPRC